MAPSPRIVTLVVDDPRGVLPVFEVESPWWMESGPVVEAARLAFGLEVSVLRLLSGDDFPGGPVTYLVEVPALLGEFDRDSPLEPWAGEIEADPLRSAYAKPGGIAELTSWVDQALDGNGAQRRGSVEQVRTWNLSCLLRVRLTDGAILWLKAVPSFFAHEAAVMQALAAVDPTLVPDLVAIRPGATLMREAGQADGYGMGPDRHLGAVRRFESARRELDLAELSSVPRFSRTDMVTELSLLAERYHGELTPDDRGKLAALIDQVPDRWAAAGNDETLVHGDLHGGNLRLSSDRPDMIIDWGDASISHPLFDLAVLDGHTPEWASDATDRWLDVLGLDRPAWTAFRPLAAIRLAVVYRRFCDGIEPSEQIYHREDIVPAIRSGLAFFTG